jgi:hypothetical protein
MWTVWLLNMAVADPSAAVGLLQTHHAQRALPSAPLLPDSAYAQALEGSVPTGLIDVPGHKARIAWGVAVVDQPIERFWAAVNDDRNKTSYTKLEHLELLEGSYCSAKRLVFQYLGVSMLTDRWWVVDQTHNTPLAQATGGAVREVSWKSRTGYGEQLPPSAKEWADQGLELPFTEGAWTLVDLGDGRTLVQYYAWSDPGGNIPARMASSFAEGGISDTIASMNRLATKGPSCL